MAQVTEIITKFSFEGSTSPLKNYNNSLGRAIGMLAGMTAALGVAAFAVAKWAGGVSQSLQPLFDLSAQTGVAVAALQELSFAAEQSNSSSQALESSISGLSAKIGEAAQKGSEYFSRLGISVLGANGHVKDSVAILGEVGNSFRRLGLSMAEQQSFAEALGIDKSLLTMLGKTGAEIEALKKRARDLGITLSPQDQKVLEEYNASIKEMDSALSGLKNKIAVAVVPMLGSLGDSFADVLADNSEWIDDGIEAAVELLKDLGAALKRTAPFILGVGAAFAIAAIGTSGFAAALGFVFSPAVLIAAGILAVLLILDDLIVAFRGGKSFIAEFFQEFFDWDIQPILQGVVDVFGDIWSGAKIAFDALKPFAPALLIIGAAFAAAAAGPALFGAALALVTSPITLIIAGVAALLWVINDLNKAFTGGDSKIMDFFGMIGDMIEWVGKKITGLLPEWAVNLLGLGGDSKSPGSDGSGDGPASQPNSQAMQPGGAVTNVGGTSSSIEQTVNMEIRTSDPERAGRAAADGLQRQMDDALTQSRRGGK